MTCPTCGKATERKDNPYRPFCSERCKLLDFGRWVTEEYRVPAEKISDQDSVNEEADAEDESET
jgi:uncharacterized protein